jgi:hypothetical protein
LGKPANKETKLARMRAHATFDQIWKQRLVRNRWAAYNWLRQVMGMSESQGHIANFNIEQCSTLMRLVCRDYPTLKTRNDRLLYDDPFGFDEPEGEEEAYPF